LLLEVKLRVRQRCTSALTVSLLTHSGDETAQIDFLELLKISLAIARGNVTQCGVKIASE
jgi:hypothetical protein